MLVKGQRHSGSLILVNGNFFPDNISPRAAQIQERKKKNPYTYRKKHKQRSYSLRKLEAVLKFSVLPAGPWHEFYEDLREADRLFTAPQPSEVLKEETIFQEKNFH